MPEAPAETSTVRGSFSIDSLPFLSEKSECVVIEEPFLGGAEADEAVDSGESGQAEEVVGDPRDAEQKGDYKEGDFAGEFVLGVALVEEGGKVDRMNQFV